jgi:hypothetical protein
MTNFSLILALILIFSAVAAPIVGFISAALYFRVFDVIKKYPVLVEHWPL